MWSGRMICPAWHITASGGRCWNLNTLLTLPYHTLSAARPHAPLTPALSILVSFTITPPPHPKRTVGSSYHVTWMLERCEGSGSRSNGPFGPWPYCWPRKDERVRIWLPSPWGDLGVHMGHRTTAGSTLSHSGRTPSHHEKGPPTIRTSTLMVLSVLIAIWFGFILNSQ